MELLSMFLSKTTTLLKAGFPDIFLMVGGVGVML